jgi:transcriptional regulator with XRE-family HTH domain
MYPNLKLQLFRTGIRQNRLAQMLGMDATVLSKIINGFREPTEPIRKKIALLLKSDDQWLFERTEPMADSETGTAVEGADSQPADTTLSAKPQY